MSDKSKDELEDRVAELEATVQKMLPNRRQALKGMAGAAGFTALGFSAGNASAQADTSDGDGNVGLPNERIDIFADGVDANTLETDDINATSLETEELSVGSEQSLATIPYDNVESERELDTVYQNDSDRLLFVCVIVVPEDGVDYGSISARVNDTSNVTPQILVQQVEERSGTFTHFNRSSVSFFVPPGHYYELVGYDVSLFRWREMVI